MTSGNGTLLILIYKEGDMKTIDWETFADKTVAWSDRVMESPWIDHISWGVILFSVGYFTGYFICRFQ